MFDFDRLLNWKLLPGSHEFPGPDGGTCVAEAAIVAAGHPYRRMRYAGADGCPPSFSRPLTAFAIELNDAIEDDALRQELLLPFVTRLDGSADTPEVEDARARLLLKRTISDILAPTLVALGFHKTALLARLALDDLRAFDDWLAGRSGAGCPALSDELRDACSFLILTVESLPVDPAMSAMCSCIVATTAANEVGATGDPARVAVYRKIAAILEAAFAIGSQAPPLAPVEIATRMQAAKQDAVARAGGSAEPTHA
jgi:hypothetical protein